MKSLSFVMLGMLGSSAVMGWVAWLTGHPHWAKAPVTHWALATMALGFGTNGLYLMRRDILAREAIVAELTARVEREEAAFSHWECPHCNQPITALRRVHKEVNQVNEANHQRHGRPDLRVIVGQRPD